MSSMVSEPANVELWVLNQLERLGFSPPAARILLDWGVDYREARRLLFKDGERTSCSHSQAMRILRPLDPPAPRIHPGHSVRV